MSKKYRLELDEIVHKHLPNLQAFVDEMAVAGINPRYHRYGETSDSFTIMIGRVPLTFGKAECSEAIKIKLARLDELERKIQDL